METTHETRCKYANQGTLIDLLNSTPTSKWTEIDEYCDNLLHHACRGALNFDAFIILVKSGLFDLNAPGQGNWTPLGFCIGGRILQKTQILCLLGCTKVTKYSKNIFNYFNVDDSIINRFLISIGFRLNNSVGRRRTLMLFQNGVIKCRNIIVILLGLKKRKIILTKLDRFLVQQELAVAIWATRCQSTWSNQE